MFAAPAEGILKDFMEFAETGCGDHEQAPPNQRTHVTEHYAKLINRNRRYGRFRHASSLPKPTRTPSNLTPPNLPLSQSWAPAPWCAPRRFATAGAFLERTRPTPKIIPARMGRDTFA